MSRANPAHRGGMRRLSRALAIGVISACLVMTAFGLASLVLPGSEQLPDRPSFLDVLIFSAIFMTFPTVGLVLAWHRPDHPIGWLLQVVGLSLTIAVFATEYAGRSAFGGLDLPGDKVVAWLGSWSWSVAAGIALPLAILLFPDGRLPGARWRPVVRAGLAVIVLGIAAVAVDPRPIAGYEDRLANPFAVGGPIGEAASAFVELGTIAIVVMPLLAVAALVGRFRRSRGPERQQIKWLLYPMALFVMALTIAAITMSSVAWSIALTGLAGTAVGIGIAILRYRLYDIDVVIRRTLVYGVVVAVLGAVYVGLILVLQTALSQVTGGGPLPVALGTLVIAALFGPVRAQVRELVDRRFYRARYSAQRTLETFGVQLRDEVELEAVARRLVEVADSTVRPASTSVWLRPGGAR